MRTRPNGYRYCRACCTISEYRRRRGEPKLDPVRIRVKIDRRKFAALCSGMRMQRKIALELSGISEDCMGKMYKEGLGPRQREALCKTLRIEHDILFPGGNV